MREIGNSGDGHSELGNYEQQLQVVGSMERREVEMPPIEAAGNMISGIVTGIVIERIYEDDALTYNVDIQAVEGATPHHRTLAEREQIEQTPPAYVAKVELDDQTTAVAARYTHYQKSQFTKALISFGDGLSLTDEEYAAMSGAVAATMIKSFHPMCQQISFQIDGGEGRLEMITIPGGLS